MVWPCVPVEELATLVTVRSAIESTPRVAVAATELVPTDVVKEPAGIVLVSVTVEVPEIELVTTVVTVQLEPGGTTVPADKVKVPRFAVAAAVPALQLVWATEVALTRLTG